MLLTFTVTYGNWCTDEMVMTSEFPPWSKKLHLSHMDPSLERVPILFICIVYIIKDIHVNYIMVKLYQIVFYTSVFLIQLLVCVALVTSCHKIGLYICRYVFFHMGVKQGCKIIFFTIRETGFTFQCKLQYFETEFKG